MMLGVTFLALHSDLAQNCRGSSKSCSMGSREKRSAPGSARLCGAKPVPRARRNDSAYSSGEIERLAAVVAHRMSMDFVPLMKRFLCIPGLSLRFFSSHVFHSGLFFRAPIKGRILRIQSSLW